MSMQKNKATWRSQGNERLCCKTRFRFLSNILGFRRIVSVFVEYLIVSKAVEIVETFECFKRTTLTPLTIVAHQTLSADSISLVLSATNLTWALGTYLVTAGIYFPTVSAVLDILDSSLAVEAAAPGHVVRICVPHHRHQDHHHHQHDGGRRQKTSPRLRSGCPLRKRHFHLLTD